MTSNISNFKGQSCSPFVRKMPKDVTGYLCCVLEECRVRKWEPLFCLCTEAGKQSASSSALWAFCCWYCNRSDWQVTATVKPQPSTFCSHPGLTETKLNKAAKKKKTFEIIFRCRISLIFLFCHVKSKQTHNKVMKVIKSVQKIRSFIWWNCYRWL